MAEIVPAADWSTAEWTSVIATGFAAIAALAAWAAVLLQVRAARAARPAAPFLARSVLRELVNVRQLVTVRSVFDDVLSAS